MQSELHKLPQRTRALFTALGMVLSVFVHSPALCAQRIPPESLAATASGPVLAGKSVIAQEGSRSRSGEGDEYGLVVEGHDLERPSVIPPMFLSTFLGGSGGEGQYGPGVAVDSSGNVYVSDFTQSPNFPTLAGIYDQPSGGLDRFVAKLDPNLTDLVSVRLFGGTGHEFGSAISLDPHGCVYLAGYTESPDFPMTERGFDQTHNGGRDVFVMRFDRELKTVLASTYLGGSGDEGQTWPKIDLALDEEGNVFVAGITNSSDFPTTSGAFDRVFHGGRNGGDAFVAKLSHNLDALLASTLLGGSEVEWRISTALADLHVLVTGETYSRDFPTTPGAYDTSFNGGSDIFLAKFTKDLSSVSASTFLGTAAIEEPLAVKVNKESEVFITGYTKSPDFPVTDGAFDTTYGGGERDAFLAKFDSDFTTLLAASYLGGGGAESGRSMAVDEAGRVLVTGNTTSVDFPTIPGALNDHFSGGMPHGDVFVARFDNTLSVLQASTFLGGEGDDSGNSIVLGAAGVALVAGTTASEDFPTSALGFDRSFNGGTDVFVSRLIPLLSGFRARTPQPAGIGRADDSSDDHPFEYERGIDLNYQEHGVESSRGIVVRDVSYSSVDGDRAVAFLVQPRASLEPGPGVIFLHWGQGDRHEFLDEAALLAEHGVVSLLLDAPWNRPSFQASTVDRMVIQTVTDVRRGLDLLCQRTDVDRTRLGYVGHSFGATWGGVLVGVEPRLTAVVLMAGYGRPTVFDPPGATSPSERLEPIHFIGRGRTAAVLFQFAERDEFVPKEAALEYYAAAQAPKEIRWYAGGHQLDSKARADRVEWLLERLGL